METDHTRESSGNVNSLNRNSSVVRKLKAVTFTMLFLLSGMVVVGHATTGVAKTQSSKAFLDGGPNSGSKLSSSFAHDTPRHQVNQTPLFCTSVNVVLNIFDGKGKISIDGSSYSNGETVSLCSGEKYTIAPSGVASGYSFFEWEETGGEFGGTSNQWTTVSTTTFYPEVSYCVLALILNASNPEASPFAGAWAGYVESGAAFARVSATFTVQVVSYISGVKNSSHPQEFVLQWVGIGGVLGTSALWQIGLIYMVNSSTSRELVQGFFEATSGSSGNTGFVFAPFYANPGDTVTSVVTYSNGVCAGYLNDSTTGSKFSENNIKFYPDVHTADWVIEDPQYCGGLGCAINQYVIPQFNTMSFGSVGSNAGTLVGPVAVLWISVEWALLTGGSMTQYLYPKTITTPNAVIIAYSQSG